MYKNLENFIYWLRIVAKAKIDETYIEETLKELEQQHCNTGMDVYELSPIETKSGKPETYSYYVENEDGDIIIICEF